MGSCSSSRGSIALAAMLAVAGPSAAAQSPVKVVAEGEVFAGNVLGNFDEIAVQDSGDWFAVTQVAFEPAVVFSYLGGGGAFVPGLVPDVPGAAVASFVDLAASTGTPAPCPTPNYQGVVALADDDDPTTPPAIGASNDRGLFWNGSLLLQEGDPSSAPGVAPGTRYTRFFRCLVDSGQDVLLLARMDDPTVPGIEDAVVRIGVDAQCSPGTPGSIVEQVLLRTGGPVQGAPAPFSTLLAAEEGSFAFNERGDTLLLAQFSLLPIERSVVLGDRAILDEYQPVPGGIGNIIALKAAALDLNDLGDYVIQAHRTTLDPNLPGAVLVRGHASNPAGQSKYLQTGDPVPDPSLGPWVITSLGRNPALGSDAQSFPVHVTNGGDVIWYGEWNDPALPLRNGGIFVNHRLVVRRGDPVGPDVIEEIGYLGAELRSEIEVSPNGRYLFFEALLSGPSGTRAGLVRVDLGESVPYGTVAQGDGGGGCSYPYPEALLRQDSGTGSPLGGFPLLGHTLRVTAGPAPAGTTRAVLSLSTVAAPGYPCGVPRSFGELLVQLIGSRTFQAPYPPGGPAVFALDIPADAAFLGTVAYAQAFFLSGATVLGATNGLRFVVGAD